MLDKQLIATRLDRLINQVDPDNDSEANRKVAKALGVSSEAVRRWRKGLDLPRLEKIDPLVQFLTGIEIDASAQYILFGQSPSKLNNVETLERIVEEGAELELLKLFRASTSKGQEKIMDAAHAYQLAHPRAANVYTLRRKNHRKR